MEPEDQKEFAALRGSNLKTARAWALKETMIAFFEYRYERPASALFVKVSRSDIETVDTCP